jgi:uroporphyrinogen III methyltransferase/synthase
VAYRTVLEEPDEGVEHVRDDLAKGEIDVVTFTSSSTVRNFASLIGEEEFRKIPATVRLASIGPETSKTLRQFTPNPVLEANTYTIEGLMDIISSELESTIEGG